MAEFQESAHPRAADGEFTTGPGREGKSVLGLRAKGASLPKEKKGGGKGGKGKGKGGKGKGDAATKAKQTKALQQALARAGFKGADGKPLKADGIIGPNTVAAIKAAQRKFGMKPDGKLTADLIRRLAKPRMSKQQLTARRGGTLKARRKPKAKAPERPRFAAGVPVAGGR